MKFYKILIFFFLFFTAPLSVFALISPEYLPIEKVQPNLCMIQAGRIYSSCIIIGEQTVVTTSHTLGEEAPALQPERRFMIFTQFGKTINVRTTPIFMNAEAINTIDLNYMSHDSKEDLVVLNVPELKDLSKPYLPVAEVSVNFPEEVYLKAMRQNGQCQFHGIGRRFFEGQSVIVPAAHSVVAPVVNSMSLYNPIIFQGNGVMTASGDSGGAYTCQMDDGLNVLVGMITAGNSNMTSIEKESQLNDQVLISHALSFHDPKVSGWLKKTICQWEETVLCP